MAFYYSSPIASKADIPKNSATTALEIEQALMNADVFATIGTSGEVYPAAGFADIANASGAQTVELNLQPTRSSTFDESLAGPASSTVPAWVDSILVDPAGS